MPDSVRALAIYEGRVALIRVKRSDPDEEVAKPYAKLVGGRVEPDETPYDAAVRYVSEAFCLYPRSMYYAGTIRTRQKNRRYIYVMEGVRPDDVIVGPDIAEVLWYDVRSIPSKWPNYRAILMALMLSDVH